MSAPRPPVLVSLAWIAFCIAAIAPALVVDSIPFAGASGIFAAGGRYGLRVAALGVPLMFSLALWAVALFRGRIAFRYIPFFLGLLALAVIATAASAFAIDRRVALYGFWIDEQGLLVWWMYFIMAFLGAQLITSGRRLAQLTWSVVATGALVGVMGLSEVAGMRIFGIPAEEWAYNRGVSTMMNPNMLGTFLVLPTVLSAGLMLRETGGRRLVAAIATAVCTSAMLLTLTRGAWVGTAAGLAVLALLLLVSRRRRTNPSTSDTLLGNAGRPGMSQLAITGGAVVMAAVIWLLGRESLSGRVAETLARRSDIDAMLNGRMTIWSELLPVVSERPLLGAGPANVIHAWQPFADLGTLRMVGAGVMADSAHNVPLDLALQFGVPFTAALIVGLTILVFRVGRSLVSSRSLSWSGLSWVAAAVALGTAFLAAMTTVPIMVNAALIIGVMLALEARSPKVPTPSTRYGVLAVSALLAVSLALWAGLTGWSTIVGNQATNSPFERAKRNQSALAVAPWRMGPAIDLAAAAYYMGNSERAVLGLGGDRAYTILLESDGRNATTLYSVGDYYLADGELDTALRLAERSLKLRPLYVPGMMLKGDALVAQGRSDEALPLLRRAVELESQAVEAHAWESPWISYLTALTSHMESDPGDAQYVREVFGAFVERFPDSIWIDSLGRRIEESGSTAL